MFTLLMLTADRHSQVVACLTSLLFLDWVCDFGFNGKASIPASGSTANTNSSYQLAPEPDRLVHLNPAEFRNTHPVAFYSNSIRLKVKR